jgi:hypothetical protein
LATTYVPKKIGEHTFLIRPDRVDPAENGSLETRMDILDSVFRARDLYAVPNAWGRSWDLLKKRFTVVRRVNPTGMYNFTADRAGRYKPAGGDPQLLFQNIGHDNLAGKDIDFLLLDYACMRNPSGPDPIMELYWATENGPASEQTVLRFFGSGTKALIPVGAQPGWLLASRIDSFRIDLQDQASCAELRLTSVELLKLN